MDQLTTVKKDIFTLIESFREENYQFQLVKLVPVIWSDQCSDYILFIQADILTQIRHEKGMREALKIILDRMYELELIDTIRLIDYISIVTDKDPFSPPEDAPVIDLLAEEAEFNSRLKGVKKALQRFVVPGIDNKGFPIMQGLTFVPSSNIEKKFVSYDENSFFDTRFYPLKIKG